MPSMTIELFRVIDMRAPGQSEADAVGLSVYPIFDEDYRATLNGLIIDHFSTREIGHETVELFRFAMRKRMNEIMPLYNRMYKADQIEFDPLQTVNLSTITESSSKQRSNTDTETENETASDSESRAINQSFPQTALAGNADYATSGATSKSLGTGSGKARDSSVSDVDGSGEGSTRVTGFDGLGAELLARYRESLVSIDLMVISELEPLFSQVWDSGDHFTIQGRGFNYGY